MAFTFERKEGLEFRLPLSCYCSLHCHPSTRRPYGCSRYWWLWRGRRSYTDDFAYTVDIVVVFTGGFGEVKRSCGYLRYMLCREERCCGV